MADVRGECDVCRDRIVDRGARKEAAASVVGRAEEIGLQRMTVMIAFASGFLVLAMEVVAQHQFAQVTSSC